MAIERTPIEIWSQIIREATRMPSWVLDGTLYDPIKPKRPPVGDIHPSQIYPLLLPLLTTKVSISLVCKTWKQICSEFLYEFLFIHQTEKIPRLVNKFRTIDMNLHKVLRIDFFPLFPLSTCVSASGHFASASALISLCPSLVAVAFHNNIFDVEDPTFVALLGSRSLRCFEWHTYQKLPKAIAQPLSPARNWSLFINYRSRSRNPPGCEWDYHDGWNGVTRCNTICGDNNNRPLEEASFLETQPNRHMILGTWVDTDLLLDHNDVIHSMNILTLNDYMLRYSSDFLSNLPPTVHTLLIYVQDLPASLSSIAKYVKRIGLKGYAIPSSAELDHYFNILLSTNTSGAYFPSLRILQFDSTLADALRSRPHQLRLWTHRCSSRDIVLYDEFGNLFGNPDLFPKVGKYNMRTSMNKTY